MGTIKNLCLIPAKAASSRLKKKNILKINGKELLYYPIKTAQDSGLFNNDIFVSTESEEIRSIAIKHGARVPYLRDKRLVKDPYGVVDVALDFLKKKHEFKAYNNIFILLPTLPMIIPEDIVKAFEIFKKRNYKCLISVTETEQSAFRSVIIENNEVKPVFPENMLKKSQEVEKTYETNAGIIILDVKDFLVTGKHYFYFIRPLGAYILPRERAVDIDTEFEYKLAKLMMETKNIFI